MTYAQRQTVMAAVFNNGAGTINPEYAFWRAMVQDSFRNGNASARWPDKRDAAVPAGKTYATLNCIEKATVDATVWASLTDDQKKAVTNPTDPANPARSMDSVDLAKEQAGGVNSDNTNIYYYTLLNVGTTAPFILTDNSTPTKAAENWVAAVSGTDSGDNREHQLLYPDPGWPIDLEINAVAPVLRHRQPTFTVCRFSGGG